MKNTRENINQQVQFIIKNIEQNILELVIDKENSRFFIYNSFDPSFKGTATSVNYESGKFLEITDFLELPRHDVKSMAYKQAFARYIEANEFLNMNFQGFSWLTYKN